MAYTKILNINSEYHLGRVARYAMREDKTTDMSDMERITEYVKNGQKTWGERFVTCLNCNPDTAVDKMLLTKNETGKTDGRLGYHIIQSFMPGEVTPEQAHQIGVEYAEKWLGDYEVVIGTHLDREHIHSHIVLNSVSCVTGKKFHLSKREFYTKLRGISDQLCRKYGLSVIEFTDSIKMPYAEYLKRNGYGKPQIRQIVIRDIETWLEISNSPGEVFVNLENMGYDVVLSGKYPKVRPPEGEKFWRLHNLGYPADEMQRIINGREKSTKPKAVRRFYCKRQFPRRKPTRFEALYLYYLYQLGGVHKKKPTGIPLSEYRKFDTYKRLLRFISNRGIAKMSEIIVQREAAAQSLKLLEDEKSRLRGAQKRFKKLFAAHQVFERYKEIVDKLDAERKEEFRQALEVMREKGFEGNEDAIGEARASLAGCIQNNRAEIEVQRTTIRQLDEVLEYTGTIKVRLAEYGKDERHEKSPEIGIESVDRGEYEGRER